MERFRDYKQRPYRTEEDLNIYDHPSEAGPVIRTRTLLEELDETSLKELFAEEIARSGLDPKMVLASKYIEFRDIIIDGRKNEHAGVCDIEKGTISIFPSGIEDYARNEGRVAHIKAKNELLIQGLKSLGTGYLLTEWGRKFASLGDTIADSKDMDPLQIEETFFRLEAIHVLIHEELHALSTQTKKESPVDELYYGQTYGSVSTTGISNYHYEVHENGEAYGYMQFDGLNEGITELIAQRLSKEYLRRTAVEGVDGSDIEKRYSLYEMFAYNRERWAAELLVLLYSVISDVPKDTILGGLTRTYLSGESPIYSHDFYCNMRELFPDEDKDFIFELYRKLELIIDVNRFQAGEDGVVLEAFTDFIHILPEDKKELFLSGIKALNRKYKMSTELHQES